VQYSLPLPKGGREGAATNPILREDQLPHRLLYPKAKKKSANAVSVVLVYFAAWCFCYIFSVLASIMAEPSCTYRTRQQLSMQVLHCV